MNHRIACAALLFFSQLTIASCARSAHSIDHPLLCKEQLQMPCLSGSVCVEDEARGCEICKCTAPPFVPLDRRGPPGTIEAEQVDPAAGDPGSASAAPATGAVPLEAAR